MLFMQSHRFCLQEQRLQGSGVLEQRLQDSGVLEAGREAACDPAVITRGPTRPNDSRQTHVEQQTYSVEQQTHSVEQANVEQIHSEQSRPIVSRTTKTQHTPTLCHEVVMTRRHQTSINGQRHAWS